MEISNFVHLYVMKMYLQQFHPEKSGKNGLKILKGFKRLFKL